MKLSEFPYSRPDIKSLQDNFATHIIDLRSSSDYAVFSTTLKRINNLRIDFETQNALASIRYSVNTKDSFYSGERDFFDMNAPHYEQMLNDYYRVLAASKYKAEVSAEFGPHFLNKVNCMLDTFHPEILQDLIKENELISKYNKLLASAEVEFEGKTQTLSQLAVFQYQSDRELRKKAADAGHSWFSENSSEFDSIFHDLVLVRHKIAIELGYKNFTELAYKRLGRTDYGTKEIKDFRDAVSKYVVPLSNALRVEQAKRIGVEKLEYYDFLFQFPKGNPFPKGNTEWVVEKTKNIFAELSPEANTFFKLMVEKELMDLESRSGKMSGGYCTSIPAYSVPFIFANSNGSNDDIRTLIHELGHAFFSHLSSKQPLLEYAWPSLETCEIHSMSLEFLAWPWTKLYFEEDNDYFQYSHLLQAFFALPMMAAGDEFQEWVYENPIASPEERNKMWLKIEGKYSPFKSNSSSKYLETGRGWQRVTHFYNVPFYFIDYALAQVCAFQFWAESRKDFKSAWKKYFDLCNLGGADSFTNILKKSNVKNPFNEVVLKEVVEEIKCFFEENKKENGEKTGRIDDFISQ